MVAHTCSKNGVASLAYVAGIRDLSLDRVKDVDGRNESGHDGGGVPAYFGRPKKSHV